MLITEEYRGLNQQLHQERLDYGSDGKRWVQYIKELSDALETQDILDYGCGKSTLSMHLPYMIQQYDPAIPRFSDEPGPADIVVCTDVLEHVEPECLGDVMKHLQGLTKKVIFAVVNTMPAMKTLPDGRNAHLTLEGPRWWLNCFWDFFDVRSFQKVPCGVMIVGEKRHTNGQGSNHLPA